MPNLRPAQGRRSPKPAAPRGRSGAPEGPDELNKQQPAPRSSKGTEKRAAAPPKLPAAPRRGPAKTGKRPGAAAVPAKKRPAAKRGRPVPATADLPNEWTHLACEGNFRALVDLSPDAIFIHQAGRYVSINPAGVRLLGANDAGDLIGRPVLDHVHPDYREFVRNRIELSYHVKRVAPLQDSRIVRLDGTEVPVEATSAPVVVKGRPATLVILRDSSWRKQHEQTMRESQSLLHTIFNSPSVLLGIVEEHGSDILIIVANAALSALYQARSGSLNGRFASVLGVPQEIIDDQLRHYAAARRRGATETWEYHRVWAGRDQWFYASATYIGRGPDGHHRYTFMAQDVTERKLAEESMQRSEAEFRGMFELSGVGMAEADPATGRFLRVNRKFCDITGYAEEYLLGKSFRNITHPEDLSIDAAKWESVVRGETDTWFSEKRYIRGDGSNVWVAVNGTCLRDPQGRPYRTIAVIQDIIDRKRAEAILRARLRLLEFSGEHTLEELLVATLDEAEALTGSRIGFLHFLEADQRTLSLQAWSTRTTREMCRAEGKGRHYDVSEAGVCVDCIHQRRAVIHNDYPSLSHRKGLPPDHAPVVREMVVPVFRGDRITAILGVGNKQSEYTADDVEVVSRLADLAWDIAGHKRAEAALQRSHDDLEQRVQARTRELREAYARIGMVLESITDGFFAMDGDFRLTYANRVVTLLWGRDQGDLIGRTLWDLMPELRGTVFEDQYRKAVAEKAPVSFEAYSPVSKKWLEVRAYPSEEGLFVFVHDITERRNAEGERLRLESAISSAAEMVVITDHRGMIQYVNPAFERTTGYSREEATGGTMHLLDSGKHSEEFFRELREKLHRDRMWEGRFISRKKDGSLYFEDCTLSLVNGGSGGIRNHVSVRRDVTERLRLEAIAESIDAMNNIGYIFSGVRHEVGNPINTAKMVLTVLQQKLDQATKETIADYVARALGEIGRVEQLLRNLKNFNLYEKQEPQAVMTASFLDSFLRLVTEDLTKKGISLSHRVGTGAEQIHADPRALQQVLLNLVTNAADAVSGRKDPRIDIEVTSGRGAAQIRITDNGRGMAEEELKNLFRPFYTTKQGGTGLGLVIVKKMLAQMGGTIEIASRKDDGTLVELSLVEGDAPPAAGAGE